MVLFNKLFIVKTNVNVLTLLLRTDNVFQNQRRVHQRINFLFVSESSCSFNSIYREIHFLLSIHRKFDYFYLEAMTNLK